MDNIVNKIVILAVGCFLLVSCSGDDTVTNDETVVADADLTGNRGQVLSVIQVQGYTYIEVRNSGRSIWLASNPVEVSEGDVIGWGQSAVMRNFKSQALDRTFDEVVFVSAIYAGTDGAPPPPSPQVAVNRNAGTVLSAENAAGYTYVEVQTDAGDSVWLAAPLTSLVQGDQIVWQGASLMRGFTSKTLARTFPEILFVSAVHVKK
ncbi:MAG: hypothetical protein DRQ63_11485 [Gammaproteobacteria bacterium]|nr:MAG: hypothetical protein DRQ63_11485 [Gammaproteobacteria bacterium]